MSAKYCCDLCNRELHLGEDHIGDTGPLEIGEFEIVVESSVQGDVDLCRGCLRAIIEGKVTELPEDGVDDVRADDHDGPIEDLL